MNKEDNSQIEKFDLEHDSISSYLFNCDLIIKKRLQILQNIEKVDFHSYEDSAYILVETYAYAMDALISIGQISNALDYAYKGLEYAQKYKPYFSGMDMYSYTLKFDKVIRKYSME